LRALYRQAVAGYLMYGLEGLDVLVERLLRGRQRVDLGLRWRGGRHRRGRRGHVALAGGARRGPRRGDGGRGGRGRGGGGGGRGQGRPSAAAESGSRGSRDLWRTYIEDKPCHTGTGVAWRRQRSVAAHRPGTRPPQPGIRPWACRPPGAPARVAPWGTQYRR